MSIEKIREPRILQRIGEIINIHGYIEDIQFDKKGKVTAVIIHMYGTSLPQKILDSLEQYGTIIDIRTHVVEGLTYPVFCLDFIPKQRA